MSEAAGSSKERIKTLEEDDCGMLNSKVDEELRITRKRVSKYRRSV